MTGELIALTEPVELLPVEVPAGLEDLGSIAFFGNETLTLGPGSYRASELLLGNLSMLHIDNAEGPVTLYVTGSVEVTGQADITTSDADPEK